MKTRIVKPDAAGIAEAAALICRGELVAFPTETVYGLGANALDASAVRRVFEAKGRPGDNPLIAHIADVQELSPLISGAPSAAAKALMEAFWPGPLTLIFPKADCVPQATSGGLKTVAVRLPSHPTAQALIRAAGVPIAAPSANRSGRPSPTEAVHVFEDMDGRIPLILDGGACDVGVESTVCDVTGPIPRVLRPGGVTPEMIDAVLGCCEVDGAVLRPLADGEVARSPGMKYRHYAPKGNLTLFEGMPERVAKAISRRYDEALAQGRKPLILALEGNLARYGARKALSLGADESGMAHTIFAALRMADTLGADVLFSESVPAAGIGLAVMNRMGRAAAFHTEKV